LGGPNAFAFTSDLSPTLGFANGGRPPVGRASLVGERGPELFVPRTAGTIIPNNALGGGNTTNNMITVNVDASGTSVQGSGSDADQLGGLIASVVQATIIDEQRAGGLLNR
jgi:phage-related minor tail protein